MVCCQEHWHQGTLQNQVSLQWMTKSMLCVNVRRMLGCWRFIHIWSKLVIDFAGEMTTAHLDLITDRLQFRIIINSIYVCYCCRRTWELGVIPSSTTSTLSATLILFQLPSNTCPLMKADNELIHYRQVRKKPEDIQSTWAYLASELYFVWCDHPILHFHLTPTGSSEVSESMCEKLVLPIIIWSCSKPFLEWDHHGHWVPWMHI